MTAYLIVCGTIFFAIITLGLKEDLTLKGEKNLTNVYYWVIAFLLSCPFLNLFLLAFILFQLVKAMRN